MITIRKYRVQDIVPAMEIWNEVVRDGIAFPQDEELIYPAPQQCGALWTYL